MVGTAGILFAAYFAGMLLSPANEPEPQKEAAIAAPPAIATGTPDDYLAAYLVAIEHESVSVLSNGSLKADFVEVWFSNFTVGDKSFRFVKKVVNDDLTCLIDEERQLWISLTNKKFDGTEGVVLVQLWVPIDRLLREESVCEAAGDLGICMQRLTALVDPTWVNDLYDWMNDHLGESMLLHEVVSPIRKGAMAFVDTEKMPDGTNFFVFGIGIPEE